MIRVIGFKSDFKLDKRTDWVEIAPDDASFDKCRSWHRIKDIRPPEGWDDTKQSSDTFKAMTLRWTVIGPAYEAWLHGQDLPANGTPIAAWAGVSADQAAHLRTLGIRSVEEVRDMPESMFNRLPFPNARALPKLAAQFLDGRGEAAKDAELQAMRERQAALEERLAELVAAQSEEPKRGPGRPRKVEAEVAA